MESSSSPFLSRIPFEKLSGLKPSVWLSVGAGFSREDFKALILSRGLALSGDSILDLQGIALRVLSHHERLLHPDKPAMSSHAGLGPSARQEALRVLLSVPAIKAQLAELKRLKRQSGFLKRLDWALQMGRMGFAHEEEEAVYSERLNSRLGPNPIRDEIRLLARVYEGWLGGTGHFDPPLLIRMALRTLQTHGWPETLRKPERILVFSVQNPESLEREFWDALCAYVAVERVGVEELEPPSKAVAWERWHTLDDAAERLADALAEASDWNKHVVLIPDQPAVRRTLKRALSSRGIPLADPRDPTRVSWDENLKWALLPLDVVSRGFERDSVIGWLRAYQMQRECPSWIAEIHARGVRAGLQSYTGGFLSNVHSRLQELDEALGGRKTCGELGLEHLKILRVAVGDDDKRAWIVEFFEDFWEEYVRDLGRMGAEGRKAPLRYWMERVRERLAEKRDLVEKLKPAEGVGVYRLHQAPLAEGAIVWMLGLPARWLSSEGVGDDWWNEREREVLSGEFAVRSGIQARRERLRMLRAWVVSAESVVCLDAEYDPDGRERESIAPVLREVLSGDAAASIPDEVESLGSHPRWSASFGAVRPLPAQTVRLGPKPLPEGMPRPEITATAMDHYSRCPFQGLAYHRWKLRDAREPDAELLPEARGNILHEAVTLLLKNRDENGQFRISSIDALEQAWITKPPKGLIRSERMIRHAKARMLQILDAFCEKEREYFDKVHPKTVSLDDRKLSLDYGDFAIIGTPDRVDEVSSGLLVMDYKTSSDLPHGVDMVESGYRLQLPFYALAAAKAEGKPAVGVQFVQLNRDGTRNRGIFFKRHNGKEPGKPTNLRSNSKSLLSMEPDEAWSRLEEQLVAHARAYLAGEFDARPKDRDGDCKDCRIGDLCGFRRLNSEDAEGVGNGQS